MRFFNTPAAAILVLLFSFITTSAQADGTHLIRIKDGQSLHQFKAFPGLTTVSSLPLKNWAEITVDKKSLDATLENLKSHPAITYIQPNYPISIPRFDFGDVKNLQEMIERAAKIENDSPSRNAIADNPDFPQIEAQPRGNDPMFSKQWGMADIGVRQAWEHTRGNSDFIVAVIDTGVDYTHEDLKNNIWRNDGESGLDSNGNDKSTNGIDDDGNGFIDDLVGWDFATDDNKPFDMYSDKPQEILKGANPGHGTHCAGNVAALGNNNKGIVGVAPGVKIMVMRFLTEKGQGTTAGAIRSIQYAVDNGAKILSNSWGSEGEEAGNPENQALRDAVQYSMDQGRLFVAAAGNGHSGRGYDNDTDDRPAYPASYTHENIVSVAALDKTNKLGPFSNWGARSVDIGAPGVKVFSTVPANRYQDKVLDYFGIKVDWNGTSMAAPHVSGAAALYWSKHPEKTWREVKEALLNAATPIEAMNGKSVANGKLSAASLLAQ